MCQLCAESIITRAGEARPGTVKSGDPAGVEGVLTYLGASRRYNGIVASLGGPRPRGHHLASEMLLTWAKIQFLGGFFGYFDFHSLEVPVLQQHLAECIS
eukprot:s2808_g3.t1